jgi:hypothetical protein
MQETLFSDLQVQAMGRFDEPLCWIFDAYLNLCKLLGKVCGLNLSGRPGILSRVKNH